MQAHLAAQDDDMWFIIIYGPIKIMKTNTAMAISTGAAQWVEKPRLEWTSKDKKKANLDNMANIFSTRFWTIICSVRFKLASRPRNLGEIDSNLRGKRTNQRE
ncbi:hypothetical protein F511_45291 [Dorcoceras hygrometricum]|uniref:Uncharacterized protein n=1 Tax=Dorcoceras hygrometricum TaxID=472368 RepID=A0A2Z6ZWD6_9LAMI|nr:hypothetical protein F511_45291 [Dorcoceras hygrometricum]